MKNLTDSNPPDRESDLDESPGQPSSDVEFLTKDALAWARANDYAGWDPYDGLNSRILSAFGRTVVTRLVGIHLVNRAPVNLRRLLGVPKERNPMGIALFARTLLYLYELDGHEHYRKEAESLLEWLREHRADGYAGSSWGYNFDWQNGRKFFLEAYEPCLVVSVLCGRAFLHHWRVTGEEASLRVGREVGEFVRTEMNVVRVDDYPVYSYTPHDEFVVINANALAASYLAGLDAAGPEPAIRDRVETLVGFLVDRQTEDGAWYYSVPPEASPLTHDNFHTGYVVESLRDYLLVYDGDPVVRGAYRRGLWFYRDHLFETDGAPRFEHDTPYPRGIHGAAQGIRTFVRDDDPDLVADARTIVEWTEDHMYDPEGFFYRSRGRYVDDTTPYIRWSQAWMCFALASYLYADRRDGAFPVVAP